ncbi:hypothetical protein [Petrimonas sp.]|uniref:hypothetical protein n=1 Tax=Petrimonas sp. TaxID=2023866 RepID=UPI003F511161
MATITNLNSKHLTDEQVEQGTLAIAQLETLMAQITVNLDPKERQRYGSINEDNKLLVNKVRDFATNQPDLRSPDVDWVEFELDYKSRVVIEAAILRLQSLINGLVNAKTLHDYDNYRAALTDYDYTTYKAGTGTPGYEEKRNELQQFFARVRGAASPPPAPEP